jgi:hypothetical protein
VPTNEQSGGWRIQVPGGLKKNDSFSFQSNRQSRGYSTQGQRERAVAEAALECDAMIHSPRRHGMTPEREHGDRSRTPRVICQLTAVPCIDGNMSAVSCMLWRPFLDAVGHASKQPNPPPVVGTWSLTTPLPVFLFLPPSFLTVSEHDAYD